LLASGWKYGGRTHGVEVWGSPDGRTMFLDEALAELGDTKEKPMDDEYIANFDGSDPLTADVTEELVSDRYPGDAVKRLLFRHAILHVQEELGGKTLRDVYDWFEHVGAQQRDEQRKALDPIRQSAGFPTFSEQRVERKIEMARKSVTRHRIVPNELGTFDSEPIEYEEHQTRGIDPYTMSPIPSSDEVQRAERQERRDRERIEERTEARRREAERRPSPSLPDGWFGS
jgi:hypothetical protein